MQLYTVVKFFHILFAIIAVGFTSSFGLLLARSAKGGPDGREVKYALGTVRVMLLIAHVCYFLLLVTGIGMVQLAGFPWSYTWIAVSLVLFAIAFAVGLGVMGPSVNRRLAILEARGPADPEFVALSKRSAMIGAALGIVTLVILWLMDAKPA